MYNLLKYTETTIELVDVCGIARNPNHKMSTFGDSVKLGPS